MGEWSFLTNHAQALICVAADPDIRLRDIAVSVGVTERAAHKLVSDLIEEGYLSKRRVGRRNCYQIHLDAPLRRESQRDHTVGELLQALTTPAPGCEPAPVPTTPKAPVKGTPRRPAAKKAAKAPARPRRRSA